MNSTRWTKSKMQFDFSEFHPLDHGIWDPVCWGWAGGIPRHVRLWWDYQFTWPWAEWKAKRDCDSGRHHMVGYWTDGKAFLNNWVDGKWVEPTPDGYHCRDCDLELK